MVQAGRGRQSHHRHLPIHPAHLLFLPLSIVQPVCFSVSLDTEWGGAKRSRAFHRPQLWTLSYWCWPYNRGEMYWMTTVTSLINFLSQYIVWTVPLEGKGVRQAPLLFGRSPNALIEKSVKSLHGNIFQCTLSPSHTNWCFKKYTLVQSEHQDEYNGVQYI